MSECMYCGGKPEQHPNFICDCTPDEIVEIAIADSIGILACKEFVRFIRCVRELHI